MTENKLPEVTPKLEEAVHGILQSCVLTDKFRYVLPLGARDFLTIILRPFITPASTPTEKLRKLADWLKGWELIEGSPENQALHIAIDQLFDPEENREILELLASPSVPLLDVAKRTK